MIKDLIVPKTEEHRRKISEANKGILPTTFCIDRSIEVNSKRVRSEEELRRLREAGPINMHNRWHVKRNLVSPDCKLCSIGKDSVEHNSDNN